MRTLYFTLAIVFEAALGGIPLLAPAPTNAQANDDLATLNRQVQQLYQARKYAEALPIAERYVSAAKQRHGEGHTEYAKAISWLAVLLRATNRLAEAEELMRRALSIDEKSLGPEHPSVARDLNDLAQLLNATNRLAEAEPLMRRAHSIIEKSLGPEHPNVAISLNNLAALLQTTNRQAEAEPLMRRALSIDEKSFGPEHPDVAIRLNNLAALLQTTNRQAEAEPLMRRALTIDEKSLGPEHPNVAIRLNNLAQLLKATNRLAEAEPLMRRALKIDEKTLGPEHPSVGRDLNNLSSLLQATNRLAEAEPLMRRALTIDEKSLGSQHPDVARDLNNLANLLKATNRLAEAEPLMRRAHSIIEKSLGPGHPSLATSLNNLAALLQITNRLAEAEPLMRRALSIDEKSFGPEHPDVAIRLNNLAELLKATNRLAEAEPLMRRALTIDEKSLGPEHPNVAIRLDNLAQLLKATNRLAEAEPLMRRALTIDEKSLGPEHPNVARDLNNLALLRAELGDWAEAAQLHRRAKPIMTAAGTRDERGDSSGLARAALTANTWALRASARAVYRAKAGSAEAREEGFELAQWALQTGAADALAQMSVRFAKGAGPLAQLVRQRQYLVGRRQGEDKRLLAAVGAANGKAAEAIRAVMDGLDDELKAIDTRLAAEFNEYAELSNPKPLSIASTQALLQADEALILFLDVPQFGKLAEESLAWVITKEAAAWRSIPLGTRALANRVAALRCGLDSSNWEDASGWPEETDLDKRRIREQQSRRTRCEALVKDKPTKEWVGLAPIEVLPFDVAGAHALYKALFGQVEDLIAGKHLIIVPSGALSSLPFHVLVTDKPDPELKGMARFKQAAWLALKQSVTVLPSVGSLQALRKFGPSQAADPYIAFGNPLLLGPSGNDKSAWDKQRCGQQPVRVADSGALPVRGVSLRAIDLAEARSQQPLPETADELCAVAVALGALAQETDTVWLGERATERNLKGLSRDGKLARYKVVHFATHGLLSGESEAILNAKAEPALLLTPPPNGAPASELEEDDGLLTASEVAQLELDADWVVLSACNTAAGEKGDAEALSGLARAFFYAKARALLVSHWYVSSGAAVKLTTKAFAALKADPKIGRAEALRRSMVELIKTGAAQEAQPAIWAPFVLVGEGKR